ncbi:5-(carboxyamino)imidazole ribonucleotide mutase, partial [Candidatus Bathyarchaeota archaeon]|nr:5-(carboxyamino)imidazole ribonucleotide mutase [Candidatus Bathyarchaeota archaeon]
MVTVSIVIGSESDRELGDAAANQLREFGVGHELKTLSAHRNPKALAQYVDSTDAEVFIAIAGLSAALPGAIAALTVKPVIGVPKEVKLGGVDALLSMIQMPTGVPVATVGVDAAKNAALLAVEILAIGDEKLRQKL